jgi:glycosyltransferase 2 family protein
MRKNTTISLILGIIISAVALYLAFRHVPLKDLTSYLKSIDYVWILPSVFVALMSFALRVIRWQIILDSAHRIGFWQAFHPLMIGFMINCILPGRVGEIARPAILKKNEHVLFSTGLATVAAERAFDVGIMIVFSAVLLSTIQIDPKLDIAFGKYHFNKDALLAVGGITLKLLVLLLLGLITMSIEKIRHMLTGLITKIPSLFFFAGTSLKEGILKRFCVPVINFIENFAAGLALVKYPAKMAVCVTLSAVIWCLSALSYYLMAKGCPGIHLSFNEIFATMLIICFFIALPSVPGFWGIWEAGGVFALAIFGISAKDAAGFTLANHAIQIFPVIIVGLVSATITSVNILQVSYTKQ